MHLRYSQAAIALLLCCIACTSLAVRGDCVEDIYELFTALDVTSLQMLDYTGKALDDMGNYDGCKNLDPTVAQYCVLSTQIHVEMADEHLPAYMGICAPASCTPDALKSAVVELLTNNAWNLSTRFHLQDEIASFSVHCPVGEETHYKPGAIICIAILSLLALFTIVGTYLEQEPSPTAALDRHDAEKDAEATRGLLSGQRDDEEAAASSRSFASINNISGVRPLESPMSNARVHKRPLAKFKDFMKCWGMRTNAKFLFMDNRGSEPSLACLNGLRTLMMAWVLLGHTFIYLAVPVGYDNLMTVKDVVGRVSFQVVPAAELAVDVFFYLSGFLVVYMVLKEMRAKNGRMPWGLFYFHRYWRLTPVYAFVIMVYANYTPYLVAGPFQFMYRELKTDLCGRYWWANILYINNFYPPRSAEQCMGWSWYLANDMQFYIITPIIVLLYRRTRRGGWALISVLLAMCMCLDFGISYHYNLSPLDPGNEQFNHLIYNKPWTRIAPYCIGIAVAFLLQDDTVDLTRSKAVRWVGYIICVVVTSSATYSTYGYWRHGWNLFQNVMYMTFARVGFVSAVGFVMYCCHKGHGAILRELLSMYVWVPLGRLTYTVYLVHPIVIFILNFSVTTPFHYSGYFVGVRYCTHIVLAYFLGFLCHMIVEKPTANLERVMLPRGKKH